MNTMRRALLLAGLIVLAGCAGAPTPAPPVPAMPSAITLATPESSGARCGDLPNDTNDPAPAALDAAASDADERGAGPQELPMKFNPTSPLAYDLPTNTIVLGRGAPDNVAALSRALKRDDLLQQLAPGEWLLAANLWIGPGTEFQIVGPSVRRLKLRSDTDGFVWIIASGGWLTFADTCVTSWDTARQSLDTNSDDGRSFVLARGGARMQIRNSELSYLGYLANESYGVAWRQPGTTGAAIGSRFGHNFYGLYSYEASNLVIRGNEVHHSTRYGIDPHTRSNHVVIENNISHHNGKQGIILAGECSDSTIRGNTVFANALHGIVIYQRSNNNLVENNTSYGNALQGINVNDSAHNTIRGNTTYDNAEAGIGVGQNASDNLVVGNTVRDNRKDGIVFLSDASRNTLRDNTVSGNARYGIYVKSPNNLIDSGNQVFGNRVGIYLGMSPPLQLSLDTNRVYDNRDANIRTGGG
jgi:parallel beta-helix repeat protein